MIRFLLRHRAAILAVLLALIVALGYRAAGLTVDPGAESMIPSRGEDLARLREFNDTFGADETIVVALSADDLFTPGRLEFLEDLTRKAGGLPHVARVVSPTNARDLDGDALGPFAVVPYEQVRSGALTPQALGARLAAHPLFGSLLVSADQRSAAVLIEVGRTEGDAGYRRELVRAVRRLVSEAPPGVAAYVAGIPAEKEDVASSIVRDQEVLVPLILAVLAAVMLALYRHPVGAIVPLAVVGASLVATLGIYALAGRALNPVTSLMAPVVLVVSVEAAAHFLSQHLAALGRGLPRPQALEEAFARTRVPCFNAAFTTAIGFGSLVLMPIPAIRDFGLFTAAGVMLSYVFSMVLAPLLLATLPDPPPRRAAAFRPGALERTMQAAVRGIVRYPLPVAAASVAILVLSLAGLARIRVETDLIAALRHSSPLYQATRFIDEHLTGVNSLEILVPGVSPADPDGLRRVERFERAVRALPGIRKVLGLPDLMARVHRAFHAGDDTYGRLPEGPEAADDLADIRELLEKEAPADLVRFVSKDGATLRVAARAAAMDTSASQVLFERIRAAARAAGLEGVTLTGNFVVLSDMSTSLVRNQVQGLVPAFLMILLAMMVQFRSWRLGLLSAVPNGAPVVMVYGLMGWAGVPLSVPTAMIASVAVGMTVDTTIHLMARFREAFASGIGYEPALEKMIDASGRAVVFATLPVALGFFMGVFGSFLPSVHFAVLTGTALLLGLVAEIVLLPLMLVLFRPLGREKPVREAAGREAAGPPATILPVILAGLLLAPFGWASAAVLLRDQNGRQDGPGLHRGETLLLLHGKPAGLRRMKTWEKRILAKAGAPVVVLRAVDVRELRGQKNDAEIDARLRREVPPEVAILVDRDGALARAYALPDAEVSVTVIDPSGKACETAVGPADEEGVGRVTRILAGVREKGRCP